MVDCDTGDVFAYTDDEFTALLYEFKAQIAAYLATLTNTSMRTLADLIRFNAVHCQRELVYYGQEIFELAEQTMGYPTNPMYVHARAHARYLARSGIDRALASHNLDAIVAPHLTNSTGPAVAGYAMGLSWGFAIYSKGSDLKDVLNAADQNMYQQKVPR